MISPQGSAEIAKGKDSPMLVKILPTSKTNEASVKATPFKPIPPLVPMLTKSGEDLFKSPEVSNKAVTAASDTTSPRNSYQHLKLIVNGKLQNYLVPVRKNGGAQAAPLTAYGPFDFLGGKMVTSAAASLGAAPTKPKTFGTDVGQVTSIFSNRNTTAAGNTPLVINYVNNVSAASSATTNTGPRPMVTTQVKYVLSGATSNTTQVTTSLGLSSENRPGLGRPPTSSQSLLFMPSQMIIKNKDAVGGFKVNSGKENPTQSATLPTAVGCERNTFKSVTHHSLLNPVKPNILQKAAGEKPNSFNLKSLSVGATKPNHQAAGIGQTAYGVGMNSTSSNDDVFVYERDPSTGQISIIRSVSKANIQQAQNQIYSSANRYSVQLNSSTLQREKTPIINNAVPTQSLKIDSVYSLAQPELSCVSKKYDTDNFSSGHIFSEFGTNEPEKAKQPEQPAFLDVIEVDPCKVVIRKIAHHFPKTKHLQKSGPFHIRKRPWSKYFREHLSSYYRKEKFAKMELSTDNVYRVLQLSPLTVVAIPRKHEEDSDSTSTKGASVEVKVNRRLQTARKRGYGRLNRSRKAVESVLNENNNENGVKRSRNTKGSDELSKPRPLLMSALKCSDPPLPASVQASTTTQPSSLKQNNVLNQDGIQKFNNPLANVNLPTGPCVTAGLIRSTVLPGQKGDDPANYLVLKTSQSCYFVPVGRNAFVVPISSATGVVSSMSTTPIMSTATSVMTASLPKTNKADPQKSLPVPIQTAKPTAPVKTVITPPINSPLNQTYNNSKTPSPPHLTSQTRSSRKFSNNGFSSIKIKPEPITTGYPGDADDEPPQLSPAPSPVPSCRVRVKTEVDSETDDAWSRGEPDEEDDASEEQEPRVPFKSIADLYRSQQNNRPPDDYDMAEDEDAMREDRIQKLRNLLKSKEKTVEKTRKNWSGYETEKLIKDFDNI